MAAASFYASLAHVLRHEGGFVDNARDPGGATNMGITAATLARARGRPVTTAEVRGLEKTEAAAIYRRLYWEAVCGDDLPAGIDHVVFDLAVNSGPSRAARLLQRVLGVEEDGRIGPVTLAALCRSDPMTTIGTMTQARLEFLQRLSTWTVFGRGWRRRVAAVEREAIAMASRIEPSNQTARTQPRKGPTMTDVKSVLASRTVWANLIGLASIGLTLIGIDTGDVDVNKIAEAAAQLVAAASLIGSTLFRVFATKRLMG